MKKLYLILLFMNQLLISAFSQTTTVGTMEQIGTSMANFLKIGIGAREVSMGGAAVADCDNASSLYWNPGALDRMQKNEIKEAEGLKAFFINDPSRAMNEIRDLSQIDIDRSGTIDPDELALLRNKSVSLSFSDRLMESLSTHPNMLKRIKHLSSL